MRIEGIAGGANPLLRYSRILTSMRISVVIENGLSLSIQGNANQIPKPIFNMGHFLTGPPIDS